MHELRQKSAKALEMAIMKELASLSMADAKLVINLTLNDDDFTGNGADDVEILFSANLGEDLKSLAKIVSGGELSRIALALKTITAKKDDIDLMVFDEVDTGVGGKTAQMMAEKLLALPYIDKLYVSLIYHRLQRWQMLIFISVKRLKIIKPLLPLMKLIMMLNSLKLLECHLA